eukprot:scaffold30113_cov27-Tisochrysis_lutea.AAC.1
MAAELLRAKVLKLRELASGAGSADEAVRHLNSALYVQPKSVTLLVERADALVRLGDVGSAIANLKHAIQLAEAAAAAEGASEVIKGDGSDVLARAELNQRLAGMLDLRAAMLMQVGDHSTAVAYLTEAIQLLPHRPSYLMHRALAYTGCEEPKLALKDLEVSRHPRLVPKRRGKELSQWSAPLNAAQRRFALHRKA